MTDPHDTASCSCGRMLDLDDEMPCRCCRAKAEEDRRWHEDARKMMERLVGKPKTHRRKKKQ